MVRGWLEDGYERLIARLVDAAIDAVNLCPVDSGVCTMHLSQKKITQ
jgi:hypothetical protein